MRLRLWCYVCRLFLVNKFPDKSSAAISSIPWDIIQNERKTKTMKIINSSISDTDLCTQLKSHVYDILGCCQDVHRELGPWLNEYIYQEALKMSLEEKQVPFVKEYYFQVTYHGHPLSHKHYMDFLCKGNVAVECKAISSIGVEQRQQLWNYMRLTNTPIGLLYNFAPVKDQCERYYYDVSAKTISLF